MLGFSLMDVQPSALDILGDHFSILRALYFEHGYELPFGLHKFANGTSGGH
jgi:hypothetical protein